jgi:enolase
MNETNTSKLNPMNKTGNTLKSSTPATQRKSVSRGAEDIYKAESVVKLFSPEDKRVNHRNIGFRNSDAVTITDLFDGFKYINQTSRNLFVWDNSVDNEQTFIVDIALALRANMLILHGINSRPEKTAKIIRYIELIENLY